MNPSTKSDNSVTIVNDKKIRFGKFDYDVLAAFLQSLEESFIDQKDTHHYRLYSFLCSRVKPNTNKAIMLSLHTGAPLELFATKTKNPFFKAMTQDMIIEQSALLDLVKPLADIVDEIIPHEIQQDALGFLGALDLPTLPDTVEKFRPQFASNWNNTKGFYTGIPFRIKSSSMTLSDDQHWKGCKEEMDLQQIMSIPTAIVSSINPDGYQDMSFWNVADPPGTVIFQELVGPNSELADWYDYAADPAGIIPTGIAYASSRFNHWTGGIVYEVEVISCPYHKGSLRLSFHPGVFDAGTIVTVQDKASQYFTVANLTTQKTKFRITVPYISHYPWLLVRNSDNQTEYADCSRYNTGIFQVSVIKSLIASGVAATQVGVVIRRAADQSFQLANLTMHNSSIQLANSHWELTPFVTQSEELVGTSIVDTTIGTTVEASAFDVVAGNFKIPAPLKVANNRSQQAVNEKSWSLCDTMNKRSLFDTFIWDPTQPAHFVTKVYDVPNDINTCELGQIAKNRFTNWEGNVVITIDISSSPFQTGRFAFVWLPLVAKANILAGQRQDTFLQSLTQIDFSHHVLVAPSSDKSYQLTIPYRHPQANIFMAGGDSLGTLVCIVYKPISAVAGANPTTLSLHAHFENTRITVPRPCVTVPTGLPFVNKNSQLSALREKEIRNRSGAALDEFEFVEQSAPIPDNPTSQVDPVITSTLGKEPSKAKPRPKKVMPVNDVHHFEDVSNDLQAMLKKASYSAIRGVTLAGDNPLQTTLDVANDILFPNGFGTLEANNGGGLLGWFAPLWRAFRGDVRLRMVIQVGTTAGNTTPEVHGYVTMSYPDRPPVALSHDAIIANAMLWPAAFPTDNITPSGPNSHTFIISPSIPEIVEIEIPFNHVGQFCIPATYSGDILDEPYSLGQLSVVLVQSGSTPEPVPVVMRFYASIGDSARFGVPWMIPKICIIPNLYPDLWRTPTALKQTIRDKTREVDQRLEKLDVSCKECPKHSHRS